MCISSFVAAAVHCCANVHHVTLLCLGCALHCSDKTVIVWHLERSETQYGYPKRALTGHSHFVQVCSSGGNARLSATAAAGAAGGTATAAAALQV